MVLPKRIEPCPIKEAIVEIRFETALPGEAVFGVVYNSIKDRYKELEKLPILQLPEVVRMNDPNLVHQPHYRLKKDNFLIQIGPQILSVVVVEPYPGWETFLGEIEYVFTKVHELGIIDKVTRFGIRYVDFFNLDIAEKLKIHILLNEHEVVSESIVLRIVFDKGSFHSALQISNDVTLEEHQRKVKGSALDLDTYSEEKRNDFFLHLDPILTEAHTIEKELFFSLLRPEFLESLNPTY
jgi:uncharacterized protein (TIGR04255 family)